MALLLMQWHFNAVALHMLSAAALHTDITWLVGVFPCSEIPVKLRDKLNRNYCKIPGKS